MSKIQHGYLNDLMNPINIIFIIWPVSRDSLIYLRIANRKKRIMVDFGIFLGKLERIMDLKCELTSELYYTGLTFEINKESNGFEDVLQLFTFFFSLNYFVLYGNPGRGWRSSSLCIVFGSIWLDCKLSEFHAWTTKKMC